MRGWLHSEKGDIVSFQYPSLEVSSKVTGGCLRRRQYPQVGKMHGTRLRNTCNANKMRKTKSRLTFCEYAQCSKKRHQGHHLESGHHLVVTPAEKETCWLMIGRAPQWPGSGKAPLAASFRRGGQAGPLDRSSTIRPQSYFPEDTPWFNEPLFGWRCLPDYPCWRQQRTVTVHRTNKMWCLISGNKMSGRGVGTLGSVGQILP